MIALIQANIIPMAAAAIIGLLTARWAFRRRPAAAATPPAADPEKSE
jgi:hypothetical protein